MGLISSSARSDDKHKRVATDTAFRIISKAQTHFVHFPVYLFLYFQITIFVLCSTVTGYNQFHFFITSYIGPCPNGWTHFKSYCYFVSIALKSWQAARTYCKSKGGDLVKIHSDEENEFVLNLVYKHAPSTKQVWIGLKWNARLSKFIWVDNRFQNTPTGTLVNQTDKHQNHAATCGLDMPADLVVIGMIVPA